MLGNKNHPSDGCPPAGGGGRNLSIFSLRFPFTASIPSRITKSTLDWLKTGQSARAHDQRQGFDPNGRGHGGGRLLSRRRPHHSPGRFAYGGTGAAPEIAKKNIALPIEYALSRIHHFLINEGIRDEIVLMASGGVRSAFDIAKAIALGADGVVIGTADLVAIGCDRLGACEKDKGCPFGITTTDPVMSKLVDPVESAERIKNMYRSWRFQLANILKTLGMKHIRELRGRTDLLVYLDKEGDTLTTEVHHG